MSLNSKLTNFKSYAKIVPKQITEMSLYYANRRHSNKS